VGGVVVVVVVVVGRRECSMEGKRLLTLEGCLAKSSKVQHVEVFNTGCHMWPRDGISGLPGSPAAVVPDRHRQTSHSALHRARRVLA
jgi:hypothetical protein